MRRCFSLKLKTRPKNIAVVLSALREKRITIFAWFSAGAIAMYFEAIAIAAELRDFPGGPEALAKTMMPTIEGLRIIRWPADRLDTLGGYLTYHNVTLFNFFLALFAAIQGARLVRHLEETKDIDFYISSGISRSKLIYLRSFSYFVSQIIISLGLGLGTAFALSASGEANTSGALITLLAGGLCIIPFFGIGLFISQFVSSSRTASGITSIIATILYLVNNVADKYSWLTWIKYISPFYYANLSRPIIPGFGTNYWSWLLMISISIIFILFSSYIFNRRDIGSIYFESSKNKFKSSSLNSYTPKTLISDMLWRQRIGLFAWSVTTAIFIYVFISMMSDIVGIWEQFAFLQQFESGGFGDTAEKQYLAMVFEILPPFIAGFIISQGSYWTSDLNQGRVQMFLSTPITYSGLIFRRFIATLIGTELIILASFAAVLFGSQRQNVSLDNQALLRVFVMSTLFAIAFTSFNAILVAVLKGRNATTAISIYVGAAWMIGFMVPYLKWPDWVIRLSIFDSFGHPFIEWPERLNFILILVLAIPGLVLAMFISEKSSKVN